MFHALLQLDFILTSYHHFNYFYLCLFYFVLFYFLICFTIPADLPLVAIGAGRGQQIRGSSNIIFVEQMSVLALFN